MSRFTHPKSFVVLDIERLWSFPEHDRYLSSENLSPQKVRRMLANPATREFVRPEWRRPRWPFDQIMVVSMMHITIGDNQTLEVQSFASFAQEGEVDEAALIRTVLQRMSGLPIGTALVTYSGDTADIGFLTVRAAKHGIALPEDWRFLLDTRSAPMRHLDLLTRFSRGHKLTMVHLGELAAAFDIPLKFVTSPRSIAAVMLDGDFETAKAACEVDIITTSLVLAHWLILDGQIQSLTASKRQIADAVLRFDSNRRYRGVIEGFIAKLDGEMMREANHALAHYGPQAA